VAFFFYFQVNSRIINLNLNYDVIMYKHSMMSSRISTVWCHHI